MDPDADASGIEYWNTRYQVDKSPFDLYHPWPTIKPLLKSFVVFSGTALNVGCGTSPMSEQLLRDGFSRVISVDISDVIIRHLRAKYRSESRLEWQTADCTSLPLDDNSVEYVFDKGTLDCLTTSYQAEEKIAAYLNEVARVLAGDGCAVFVSFGPPVTRERYFRGIHNRMKSLGCVELPKQAVKGGLIYVHVLRKEWMQL
jgi:ubiquinone/menaquinone biosynthesis C-methylase UbiE